MQTFISTFQAIAILLFLGTVGFVLLSRKFIPEKLLGHLTSLVLELALPALIFTKLIRNFDPSEYASKLMLPINWVLFTIMIFIISKLFSYIAKSEVRSEFLISLVFQNSMFIPIVLISELYGENSTHLIDLFLFAALYPALFFNTYFLFFAKKRDKIDWRKVFHPVLIATVVAVLVKFVEIDSYIPSFALSGISLIGNMTIPLLMIVLGGTIYLDYTQKGKINYKEMVKFVLIKNIIFPAIALTLIWLMKIEFDLALLLIILSAVPPLTALPVVMDRVGGKRHMANQFLVASVIFSLITIPLVMTAFEIVINGGTI